MAAATAELTMFALSPRLFISYSRQDARFVDNLVASLRRRGFAVFRDTSDISPGDNFVSTIAKEIRRATGVVAVISDGYAASPWGKAELYSALTSQKVTIPVIHSEGSLRALDEPLRRLLQDTNYIKAESESSDPVLFEGFATLLATARARYRREIIRRLTPIALVVLLAGAGVWWGITNLNRLDQTRRRDAVIAELVNAKRPIEHSRIAQLASTVAGDREGIAVSNDANRRRQAANQRFKSDKYPCARILLACYRRPRLVSADHPREGRLRPIIGCAANTKLARDPAAYLLHASAAAVREVSAVRLLSACIGSASGMADLCMSICVRSEVRLQELVV